MKTVEGWNNKNLSELADYINGYAFKPDDWGKDGLPIIRIEQLKNPDASTDYYSGKIPTKNIIENGDLIFSWSASLFLRIWKNDRAALNQHLFRVIEKEGIDRVFLKLFIEYYLPELVKASHGSTMQHITRKELYIFNAPYPTFKPEQTKIAEILSTVDHAIEQTKALIAKQQRIKTGMMQDLLTRGIDEDGNLRSEQTHEFKDSPLGRIPVEWGVKKLSEATAKIITYGIVQPGGHVPEGVPFIQTKDLTRGQLDSNKMDCTAQEIHSAYERSAIHTGDIVIGIRASVGCVAEVPKELNGANISRGVARLSPSKILCGRYLFWIVQAVQIQKSIKVEIKGSTYPEITLPALRNIFIPIPNPDEQDQIVKSLDISATQIRRTEGNLTKLRSLKTALMQDLLTGKKRVTALLNDTEAVHG